MAFSWRKSSNYSIVAHDEHGPTDYAVSHARVWDGEQQCLFDTYTAWHGPNLRDQPRETSRPAKLLGVRRTAEGAKALCLTHWAAARRAEPGHAPS